MKNNCKYCNKKIKFWQKKLKHPNDQTMIWHDSCYKQNYPYALYVAFKVISKQPFRHGVEQ